MIQKIEKIKATISIILIIMLLPTFIVILDHTNLSNKMHNAGVTKNIDKTISENELKNVLEFFSGKNQLSNKFNYTEKQHMQDVKKIINALQILLFLALLFFIYYSAKQIAHKNNTQTIRVINLGSKIVLGLGALLLFFVLFFFNKTFEIFHKIFFPQGNWSFPAESWLITLFPQQFFISISIQIFLTITGLSLLLLYTTILIKNLTEKNRKEIKKRNKK